MHAMQIAVNEMLDWKTKTCGELCVCRLKRWRRMVNTNIAHNKITA